MAPLLVAGVDELEEQVAAAGDDRQVADLVDDEQRRPAEEADALVQPAFALGPGQRGDEVGQRGEVDALSGLDGLDAERGGEVALAGAGRAEEVDDLAAVDEVELGQRQDAVAVERGLEGEVEAGQRLDRGQAGHAQRRLDAAVLAQGQLFRQQDVDGLERGDLALLDAAHDMVERFQRARHLQADQVVADAVDRRRRGVERRRSWPLLPRQSLADGIVEGQRALGDPVAGAVKDDLVGLRSRPARSGLSDAMTGQRRGACGAHPERDGRRSARRPRGCGSRRPACAPRRRAGGWRRARCRNCRRRRPCPRG